ncbi:hypothetical protein TpMuguga_01g00410 [Theileria parva strain Muguga]|uniref:Uncharacterized protein n=1 Tax=Theileria parva TaxID=5875 RepID=Q4N8Q4_THEPA|nr:uncharacterized protein TpMuguga_01g00410 [Theileria parva strain Muguga]EAN33654.1 hypothetical protein TpMuguga_01g00410 [Theileria parva strain Muguga]|eukprot:XP_765937.1 hypothetical protein [Theileria parva strain Muguga]
MGLGESLKNIALFPLKFLRYKTASNVKRERVIKLGILCRKSWVLFPPIMLYQYLRQTDRDHFTTELFYKNSSSDDSKAFYDPDKPKHLRNWKIQSDLALLSLVANQKFNQTEENDE